MAAVLRRLASAPSRRLSTGRPVQALVAVRDALNMAIAEEMERDETVVLLGEEVGQYHGAYKVGCFSLYV